MVLRVIEIDVITIMMLRMMMVMIMMMLESKTWMATEAREGE